MSGRTTPTPTLTAMRSERSLSFSDAGDGWQGVEYGDMNPPPPTPVRDTMAPAAPLELQILQTTGRPSTPFPLQEDRQIPQSSDIETSDQPANAALETVQDNQPSCFEWLKNACKCCWPKTKNLED